jgi:hypothetical protein
VCEHRRRYPNVLRVNRPIGLPDSEWFAVFEYFAFFGRWPFDHAITVGKWQPLAHTCAKLNPKSIAEFAHPNTDAVFAEPLQEPD